MKNQKNRQQWGPGYGPQAAAMRWPPLAAMVFTTARGPIQTPDVQHREIFMKYAVLIFGLLFICSSAIGEIQPDPESDSPFITLFVRYLADGSILTHNISKEALLQTPAWDGTGEPPLPISTAISLATESVKQDYPMYSSFRLVYITLTPPSDFPGALDGRWVYHLNYYAENKEAHLGDFQEVVVLLDGTILKPQIEDKNDAEQGVAPYVAQGAPSGER